MSVYSTLKYLLLCDLSHPVGCPQYYHLRLGAGMPALNLSETWYVGVSTISTNWSVMQKVWVGSHLQGQGHSVGSNPRKRTS